MLEFEKYFGDILDGRIKACEKIKIISNKLMEQYLKPGEYHFDCETAERHIEFIERFCYVPAGAIGTRIKLEPFQKARLQAAFGFVDDNGLRQYNEVLIIEGRKNGKTTECAAVELDLLVNDREGAPEIYNVATKLDQAKKGYNAACNMRLQSPLLKRHVKKRAADLYFPGNMGYIKALGSNVNTLDSLDAHAVIIDELGAIKNRDLYDLMKQSMGARSQPMLFCITTNGFVRENIFDAQYKYAEKLLYGKLAEENKRFLPFIYELDSIGEWEDEECWIKANPGIGTIKSWDYLRQMVSKAKDDPSFKPTVLVKDFNMKQTSEAAWLTFEALDNDERLPEYAFRYGIGGFDAADKVDLNAAKCLCMKPDDPHIYVKSMYWIPERVLEEEERKGNRRERDSVPYSLWVSQGYLRTCPGAKCDKKIFIDWFRELRDREDIYMLYIGYDPWHIDDSTLREFEGEFGKTAMVPVRQGVATLSAPMKDLASDLKEKLIVYDNNPIDKWCLANTQVKTDINGNIQPVKGVDARNRIDGTIALINGYVVLQDKEDEYLSLL